MNFALTLLAKVPTALLSVDIKGNPPSIWLKDTLVDWQKPGYIHKLSSSPFQLIAPDQWISYDPVMPIETTESDPNNYRNWIKFL